MTAQIQAEALLLAINLKDPRIIFTLADRTIVAAELCRLLDRIAELEAQVRPVRARLEPMRAAGADAPAWTDKRQRHPFVQPRVARMPTGPRHQGHPLSRRKRERRDKRAPLPDFDQPAQQAGFFRPQS